MNRKNDEFYMGRALEQARLAYALNEVPIGCVIVVEDQVVAAAHNLCEAYGDPLAHAEILAIKAAQEKLGFRSLTAASLYVTIEPCPMCAGAIALSRIRRVIYGAPESKTGAVYSLFNVLTHPLSAHIVEVTDGVNEDECRALMREFFRNKRNK